MGVSKVVYGDNTLVDLTNDSVSATTLAKGVTAHNAAGEQVTGIMEAGADVTKETITEALGYTPTKAWYVTFTIGSDDNITADKTVAEIYQAYQDGYAVYGRLTDKSFILSLEAIGSDTASFIVIDEGNSIILAAKISWVADNSRWVLTQTFASSSGTGQSPFIVNVTASEIPSGELYSSASGDTTVTKIYEAHNAGRHVFAKVTYNNESDSYIIPLILVDSNRAFFSGVIYNGINYVLLQLVYNGSEGDFYIISGSELYATKAEIPDETTLVNKVLAALPTWTGGSY